MPNITSPLELHIEVLQGLQKVDGFQQDMFLAEELDLQLNKQQGRFVEKLTNKEFQDRQLFLDYIKNIIVKNHPLTTLTLPTSTPDPLLEPGYEAQAVYGVFPSNYLHLVSDRSTTYQRTDCADVEDVDVPTATYTERVSSLALAEVLETEFYEDFTLTNTTDTTTLVVQNDYNLRGDIIRAVLQSRDAAELDLRIYWERYRNIYVANSFLLVTPGTDPIPTYNIGYTKDFLAGGSPSAVSTNSAEVATSPLTFTEVDLVTIAADTTTYIARDTVENKLSEADDIYDFRKNKFYKPDLKEPHSTLVDNFLIAYRDKSYIITNLVIDYIRKPQQISLSLNQGCELAGEAPRIIVDKTIEYLKLVIENPAYRGIVQDNELRNQT